MSFKYLRIPPSHLNPCFFSNRFLSGSTYQPSLANRLFYTYKFRSYNKYCTMSSPPFIWIDCEMSGLDIEKDVLLEIAVIITDQDLNIIAEGPDLIINQPKHILDGMNEWCIEHHGKSGLTAAVLSSSVSLEQAESQVLDFIKKNASTPKTAILAGNSVHADKVFLARYMPRLVDHLHYRIVDVSTVKELARRWSPTIFSQVPRKAGSHRALEDIRESIAELQYYKATFFKTELPSS